MTWAKNLFVAFFQLSSKFLWVSCRPTCLVPLLRFLMTSYIFDFLVTLHFHFVHVNYFTLLYPSLFINSLTNSLITCSSCFRLNLSKKLFESYFFIVSSPFLLSYWSYLLTLLEVNLFDTLR